MGWYFMAPDKPSRVSTDFLKHIDDTWVAEVKSDGFRCEVGNFNGKIHAISRNQEPFVLGSSLISAIKAILPDGAAFDCEYLNPTRVKAINRQFGLKIPLMEKLVVFDITWLDGKWIGKTPLYDRHAKAPLSALAFGQLADLMLPSSQLFRVPSVPGSQAMRLFEEQKRHLICEGVVVKKLRSVCLGNRATSRETADWVKIKHRD